MRIEKQNPDSTDEYKKLVDAFVQEISKRMCLIFHKGLFHFYIFFCKINHLVRNFYL